MVGSLGALPFPDLDRGAVCKSAVLMGGDQLMVRATLGHGKSCMSSQLAAPDTAGINVIAEDARCREKSTETTVSASCDMVSTILCIRSYTSLLISSQMDQPLVPQGQCLGTAAIVQDTKDQSSTELW